MERLARAAISYIESGRSRFHMPGHKGAPLPLLGGISRWDITEVEGADSLYQAQGPILETERAYSRLYGSAASLLCAGGGTLCVQAMLALAPGPGGTLVIGRGAHVAAVNAMALLDIMPEWILPGQDPDTGLALPITPEQVEAALERTPRAGAVYLTSPDYFGGICDVAGVAAVCGRYGLPLLIDGAHGAHLAFLEPSLHPIGLGADLCCDSLHKTLPVLTGGAMLHIGNPDYLPRARAMLALFGSTSPSYPVLISADSALEYLHSDIRSDLIRTEKELAQVRELAMARGFLTPRFGRSDPSRLTLGAGPLGYTGPELASHLREYAVEPEYAGGRFCVLMASGFNTGEDFARLRKAVSALPDGRAPLPVENISFRLPERVLTPRQAVFSPSVRVEITRAAGRVCVRMGVPCPPGIALAVPGELIDRELADLLKNSGILSCDVIE